MNGNTNETVENVKQMLIPYTTEYMLMIIIAATIIVGTILMVAWKIQAEGKFGHFFGGVFMYAIVTACLKSICDIIIGPFVSVSLWTYGVYDAVMWGVLITAGLYLSYQHLFKDHSDRRMGVSFGLGFGWGHVMLSALISSAMYFGFAIAVNDLGIAEMTAGYTAEELANFHETLAYMQSLTVMDCVWSLIEVIARQLLLSAMGVIVFAAAEDQERRKNVAVAVCLVTISLMPLAWCQGGAGIPLWIAETIMLMGTVCACLYAKRVYDELPTPRRYSRRTKYL